jgi:phage terminase large subunit GpA-like protein
VDGPSRAAAVDTGGHFTHQAYAFVAKYNALHPEFRLYATKGSSEEGQPIKASARSGWTSTCKGRTIKKGVKLWMVGTDTAKDLLYGRFKVTQPGPGYVHFAKDLPREWFEHFGNEKRLPYTVHGRTGVPLGAHARPQRGDRYHGARALRLRGAQRRQIR